MVCAGRLLPRVFEASLRGSDLAGVEFVAVEVINVGCG